MKNIIIPYALSLTSGFTSPSLLKARIVMLYQKPSAQWALTKFGFALPILLFCMLITAFTQRESLLEMSIQTWEGFQREMQEAYQLALPTTLPAVAEKEVVEKEKEPALPAVIEKITPKEQLISALPEMVTLAPVQIVGVAQNTASVQPNDTQVQPMAYKKRQSEILHFYYLNYEEVTQSFNYIFQKNNRYFFRVVDSKSKAPIAESNVKISIYKAWGESTAPEKLVRTEEGFMFDAAYVGMYKLVFENTDKLCCIAIELSFDRGGSTPKIVYETDVMLTDMAGKEVNFKKKVAIKKGLQVVLNKELTEPNTKITQVLVRAFRDKKEVNVRTFESGVLDFTTMDIKRGDVVQIEVKEVVKIKEDGYTEKVKIKRPYMAFYVR